MSVNQGVSAITHGFWQGFSEGFRRFLRNLGRCSKETFKDVKKKASDSPGNEPGTEAFLATTAIFDSVESKSPTDAGLSWLMGGNLGCTYNLRAVPEATSLLLLELSNRHQLGHSPTFDDTDQADSNRYVFHAVLGGFSVLSGALWFMSDSMAAVRKEQAALVVLIGGTPA